jgi:basic membrane protein A
VRRGSALVLLLCVSVVAGGCGSTGARVEATSAPAVGTSAAATPPAPSLRVGLVRDAGAELGGTAALGLARARSELGVEVRSVIARSAVNAQASVAALAADGYDLVFGVGAQTVGALGGVAATYPKVTFAAIDRPFARIAGRPRNVVGVTFRDEQAGYLAGYLAGLIESRAAGGKNTVGWIGGRDTPAVERYVAGFVAGAVAADPAVTVLHDYSQTFSDQAKCKELALKHLAMGSDIEFEVAGRCGLGVLDAVNERNVWGIASVVDESSLGPQVLTSAVKHVDVAVLATIKAMQDASLRTGTDLVFDASSTGVGLGTISPRVPQAVVAQIRAVELRLGSGAIPSIPTTIP